MPFSLNRQIIYYILYAFFPVSPSLSFCSQCCVSVCLMNYEVGTFRMHLEFCTSSSSLRCAFLSLHLLNNILCYSYNNLVFICICLVAEEMLRRFMYDVYNINASICWWYRILPDSSSLHLYLFLCNFFFNAPYKMYTGWEKKKKKNCEKKKRIKSCK